MNAAGGWTRQTKHAITGRNFRSVSLVLQIDR